MANEFAGQPVNVDTLEIVELPSFEIEDLRTDDFANMQAVAFEDIAVHD